MPAQTTPTARRLPRRLLAPLAVVATVVAVGGTGYAVAGPAAPPTAYAVASAAAPGATTALHPVRLRATVTPSDGAVVGVGMPVVVRFDHTIRTRAQRARLERHLVVTTSPTAVPGSWSWVGTREVHFRPRTYWPARTQVRVALDLDGVRRGATTRWRFTDRSVAFRTGAAVVSQVDVQRHRMVVRRDGRVVMDIPVTAGKPGFTTRSGTKVVMEKYPVKWMDAATTGTPRSSSEYYRIKVRWAMRLTLSGEFVHAAPWSVASQGKANVSHGCVGMSTADAHALFRMSRVGDPVEVTGTSRGLEPGNGWTDWNRSWSSWTAGSALS